MPLDLPHKKTPAVARRKPIVLKDVLVENYAAEGKSMARVDGKVVFIENAIPGDVVDVFLNKNKADWAEGYPVAFSSFSADRIVPFCEHFGVCGGCQWQHLPYGKQLAFKQQQVFDQLTRIGSVALPPMLPIIGAQKTTAYRNKLEFTFNTRRYLTRPELDDPMVSGHGNFGGFHARGIFDKIVNINTCHLMAEPVNLIRETLKEITLALQMPFYDINQHAGWLRGVMYRYCTTGNLMVNVMLAYDEPEAAEKLLDGLMDRVPAITSLYYTINPKRNDSLTDLEPVLYRGERYATETLGGFQFHISPTSFFQTNTYQAEKLYEVAARFAELDGSQTVYDLYCGTGSIGIFVSKGAKKLIGVEVVAAAVADAKANAALNSIDHAHFFAGDVVDVCNDAFFEQHGKPDVLITDPPRAGMHPELVEKILEIASPLVVYVSCNPATQARDLRLLAAKYTVTAVQPVDMFPHTHHIENVVQLKLTATPL